MAEGYLNNASTLKIDLMLRGIRTEDPALTERALEGAGLDLVLPRATPALVPCGEEFTLNSPYLLKKSEEGYLITDGDGEVPVSLVELPGFLSEETTTGASMGEIAKWHGSYVVIAPNQSCDFFGEGVECRYCAGNFDSHGSKRIFTVEEVLDTVEAIKKDGAAEIIYLSIGFSDGPDGGIEFLAPYIVAIKKHFNMLIAVEALPPKSKKWIDETYAVGADSLLYNLEIYDKELFEVICPGRERLIGRKRYH